MSTADPSNKNYIRLSYLHVGLATAYTFLFGSLLLFSWGSLTESGVTSVRILGVFLPLFHVALAWGSKAKFKIARVISMIAGALMLFAIPIGTIIGFFLLRFSIWKSVPITAKEYSATAQHPMPTIVSTLNYFIALMTVGSMVCLKYFAPFVSTIALSFLGSGADNWVNYSVLAFIFIAIGGIWKWRGALLPLALSPGFERLYRFGNVIMTIANFLVLLSLLGSVIGFLGGFSFSITTGFLVAGVLMLAVPINIVGIVCVETSRLRRSPNQAAALKP